MTLPVLSFWLVRVTITLPTLIHRNVTLSTKCFFFFLYFRNYDFLISWVSLLENTTELHTHHRLMGSVLTHYAYVRPTPAPLWSTLEFKINPCWKERCGKLSPDKLEHVMRTWLLRVCGGRTQWRKTTMATFLFLFFLPFLFKTKQLDP